MASNNMKDIQIALAAFGLYHGGIDGIAGRMTEDAVKAFQQLHGLKVDGIVGPNTRAQLFPQPIPERDEDLPDDSPVVTAQPVSSNQWPRQKDCISFYGPPGGPAATAGKVVLPIPFRIAWALDQRITKFLCHSKVAAPITRIFQTAVAHYGEEKYRALGLDLFGGCYNLRKMRGGSSYSMHSWGIAVDIDPTRNQLKWGKDRAEFAKPAYNDYWGIVEAEGAVSLGRARDFDWMHFQFARL